MTLLVIACCMYVYTAVLIFVCNIYVDDDCKWTYREIALWPYYAPRRFLNIDYGDE